MTRCGSNSSRTASTCPSSNRRAPPSEWGAISGDSLLATSGHGPYVAQAKVVAAALASTGNSSMSTPPDVVADAIVHAATARRPKTRYPGGQGRPGILLLRRLLPDRAFDAVLWKIYKRFPGVGPPGGPGGIV